jgi:GntR family transcriptional regulator of vanillate catabolism
VEPLRKINQAMQGVSTTEFDKFTRYLDLNQSFHEGILDLANNKILRREIEQIYKFPFALPSSRALLPVTFRAAKEFVAIGQEHHNALIDALEHRERARAEAVGREHARLTRRNLERASMDPNFLQIVPAARLIHT